MTSDFDRGARDARPDIGSSGSGTSGGASFHDDRDRIGSAVRQEASAARDAASGLGGKLREGASTLADDAKARAQEQAESGKTVVASGLGDFADAVRKASDELGQKDQSLAAGLMRQVASGLEQASGAIEGKSVDDLTRSVTGFARRQPTAFLAGAALVGVALGRFARASSSHGRPYDDRSYGSARRPDDGLTSATVSSSRWDTGTATSTGSSGSSIPSSSSGSATGLSPGGASGGYGAASPSTTSTGTTGASGTSTGTGSSTTSTPSPSQLYGDAPRPAQGGATTSAAQSPTKPASAVLGSGSGSFPPKEDDNVR